MTTEIVKVDEKVRNEVEGLDYEYQSRKDLISYMISNDMKIDTDAFKAYQNELKEFHFAFQKKKLEIERIYVQPKLEGRKARWVLNYQTCEITITYLD